MIYRNNQLIGSILVVFVLLFSSIVTAGGPPLARQSSTKATEWGFDFVEEFDTLQPWTVECPPTQECGNRWYNTYTTIMPKLADGSPSAFNYFSVWEPGTLDGYAISDETASGRQIWRGTKSFTLDMNNKLGPSRFGLHLGDLLNPDPVNDGYTDFSVFYMVWMPKNHHPTRCTGGSTGGDSCGGNGAATGIYEEGSPTDYAYYSYYKFNTFNMECNGDICPEHNTYGMWVTVGGIKKSNYTPYGLVMTNANHGDSGVQGRDGIALDSLLGGWFGVEYRITNNPTNSEYTMSIWLYTNKGAVSQVMTNENFVIPSDDGATQAGGRWDHFFFGGNRSVQYGETEQSYYWIDDLIIDDGSKGLIGPRYFSAVAADLPAELSIPSNITNWLRESL